MKTASAMIVRRGFRCEVRAQGSEDPEDHLIQISGVAAVFDNVIDMGTFREVIRPGAFTKTLDEGDQLALSGHEMNSILGRKSAGTLEISQDERGLPVVVNMDDRITRHVDEYYTVQRGDVRGMSFGFSVVKERITEGRDGDTPLRELLEVRVAEVSTTAWPAYEATELEARSVLDRVPTSEPEPALHSEADDVARNAEEYTREMQLTEI